MKVLLDLNLLLDVLQKREPHYPASAAVLSSIASGELQGAIPGHALTTIHYVLTRFAGRERALRAIDWLLGELEIVPEGRTVFLRARSLSMNDFEDAVVAATAEESGCDYVITRNLADFQGSPVSTVSPTELVEALTNG